MRRSRYCLALGIGVLVLAVLWWWITYRDVVNYAYLSTREAGLCLVGHSDLCDLARALCRGTHAATALNYWWGTFWIGVAIASLSLALPVQRPRDGGTSFIGQDSAL
jgi:uncharacterized membrane protein